MEFISGRGIARDFFDSTFFKALKGFGMKKFFVFSALLVGFSCSLFAEDRSILLVTPSGVWRSDITSGIPGPFVAMPYDVIVHGAGPGSPLPPDIPGPPITDPVVAKIKEISASELKDKQEATAVAAIVNSLVKMGLTGANFKQALEMSAPIADTSLQASGRIIKWSKAALLVTADPAKLIAGLTAAFGVDQASLTAIHEAALASPAVAVTGEALNWAQIIQVIQLIFQLLRNLGIIPA